MLPNKGDLALLLILRRLQAMPQQPPVPWPQPTALPAVDPNLHSDSLDALPFLQDSAVFVCDNHHGRSVLLRSYRYMLHNKGDPALPLILRRLQAMPQQPPVPWPQPTALPAVDPNLHSESLDALPFFASREQEQATGQLSSKVRVCLLLSVSRVRASLRPVVPGVTIANVVSTQ
jgi:hypothetical protein